MGMERTKLAQARWIAGMSQEALAEALGTTRVSISRWESGDADPTPYFVKLLCDILKKQPHDLDLYGPNEDRMEITRRQAVTDFLTAAGIPFVMGANGPVVISAPVAISPGAFLEQCNASIKACWELLRHKGLGPVASILSTSMPMLMPLAETSGPYQSSAAGLASQAKILQCVLAMHNGDLAGREIAAIEAVRLSEMSNDLRVRVVAMLYHGYTYVFMSPSRPGKAIPIFLEALALTNSDMGLLRSDAYSGLANAYAQNNERDEAILSLDQAETLMPRHPEQDPSYLYADHGWPEFHLWKGRAFLDLTDFQQAYNAFEAPGSTPMTTRSASMIAVLQADAARGLGDMDHFIDLLEQGMRLAIEIDSKQRQSEAHSVLARMPNEWQRETRIQRLQRDLFPASIALLG